jgi:hypothetical protein
LWRALRLRWRRSGSRRRRNLALRKAKDVYADYVFVNGEIITVNPDNELTQAVAVRGNERCP